LLCLISYDQACAQSFVPSAFVPAAPHPLESARLAVSTARIPLGRAQLLQPVSGACSLDIRVTARYGTLDVVLLPAAEWRQWSDCAGDLPPQRVLCRDQRACSVSSHVADRQEDLLLLVGRSRIDVDAADAVQIRVTGEHSKYDFLNHPSSSA